MMGKRSFGIDVLDSGDKIGLNDPKVRELLQTFVTNILPEQREQEHMSAHLREYEPVLSRLWRYRVGLIRVPPSCGPTYYSQDYFEAFMPLTGRWRYCWSDDLNDEPAGDAIVSSEDLLFLPTKPDRCIENISSEDAWLLAISEMYQ